jgi:SAM-dependent methyltransferase
MKKKNIFLPGIDKQYKMLLNQEEIRPASILIIGGNSEIIAERLKEIYDASIIIIIENGDDLFRTRLNLKERKDIAVRQMDYSNTDFREPKFDMVFAQGTISSDKRNKIVKEISRILLPGGYFLVGEVIALEDNLPQFVKDVWKSADLLPLKVNELNKYYEDKGYEIVKEEDLTYTLKDFYKQALKAINEEVEEAEDRKAYKQAIHAANVYLKLGGDKFEGFKSLLLKKRGA